MKSDIFAIARNDKVITLCNKSEALLELLALGKASIEAGYEVIVFDGDNYFHVELIDSKLYAVESGTFEEIK